MNQTLPTTKLKKHLYDNVYCCSEFGSTSYVRLSTQRSSFTHLGRPKLQFISFHVKIDV